MNKKNETPFTPIINSARIEEGTVKFFEELEGRIIIYVKCDDRRIHPEGLSSASLTQCVPVNLFGGSNTKMKVAPPEGTKCLIMFKHPDNFKFAYYLGALEASDGYQEIQSDTKQSPGGFSHKNEQGFGYSITNSKSILFSQKSSITVQNDNTSMSYRNSTLSIGNAGFQVESYSGKDELFGTLTLSNKGLFLRSVNGIMLGTDSGDLNIYSGGTTIKNSSIFSVTSREMSLTATSKFVANMGQKIETLSGNILSPLSFDPAYQIKVISGGYSLSVAQGDIEIATMNPALFNSVVLRNGLKVGLTVSQIELNALDIVIKNQTGPLISKIEVGKGMLNMSAKLVTTINTGSFNLNTDILLKIKTPLFILDSGTVVPNAAKPYFNMMPVCPFTGAPHGGNTVIGA